jgi:hypothetical protein
MIANKNMTITKPKTYISTYPNELAKLPVCPAIKKAAIADGQGINPLKIPIKAVVLCVCVGLITDAVFNFKPFTLIDFFTGEFLC